MTTTTTAPTTAELLAATLDEQIAEAEFVLRHSRHSLVSHGCILQIVSGGSTITLSPVFGADDRTVEAVQHSTAARATRLTRADAEQLCRGGNIRNGLGHVARPVFYRDAVAAELNHLRDLRARLLDA